MAGISGSLRRNQFCLEQHAEPAPLLRALSEWSGNQSSLNSFLCLYAHSGGNGLASTRNAGFGVVAWNELALALKYPVEYLWLVGCNTQLAFDVAPELT